MTIQQIINKEFKSLDIIPISINYNNYGISNESFSFTESQFNDICLKNFTERIHTNIELGEYSGISNMSSIIPNFSFSLLNDENKINNDPALKIFVDQILPKKLSNHIAFDKSITRESVTKDAFNEIYVDKAKYMLIDIIRNDFAMHNINHKSDYSWNQEQEQKQKVNTLVSVLSAIKDTAPVAHKSIMAAFDSMSNRKINIDSNNSEDTKNRLLENDRISSIVHMINQKAKLPEFSPEYLKLKAADKNSKSIKSQI